MTTRDLKNLSPEQLLELAPEGIGQQKRLAHNTWLERTADKGVAVIFHKTPILTFDLAVRQVEVNSGGYRTKTTKQRINDLLPTSLTLFAEGKVWKMCRPGGPDGKWETWDFEDHEVLSF